MAKKRLQVSCIIILLAILVGVVPVGATSLLNDTMSLKDKLAMQLEAGSGFAYSIEVKGKTPDEPWLLDGLKDKSPLVLEGTFLKDPKNSQGEVSFTLKRQGNELLDATVGAHQGTTYLASQGLGQDITVAQSWETALLAYLFTPDSLPQGFDQLLAVYRFLTKTIDQANESLEPYRKEIDFWLQQYAKDPVSLGDSSDGFTIDFLIPPEGIKEGMKALLDSLFEQPLQETGDDSSQAFADHSGLLLGLFQQFENQPYGQQMLSLIQNNYDAVLGQIDFPQDLLFSRTFKTFGELEKSTLTLPFSQSFFGFNLLKITYDEKGQVMVEFFGERGEFGFSYTKASAQESSQTINGSIFYYPANSEEKIIALSYTLTLNQKNTVESEKIIEEYDFTLLAVPLWKNNSGNAILSLSQKAQYWLKENTEITGSLQLISESSKSKPVEIIGKGEVSGLQFLASLTFEGRSQGPWPLKALTGEEQEIDISGLKTLKADLKAKVLALLEPIMPAQDIETDVLSPMETAKPQEGATITPDLHTPFGEETLKPSPQASTPPPEHTQPSTEQPAGGATDTPTAEVTPKAPEDKETEGIIFY